ncbi:hypothetical protein Tco_0822832 [Tanacetum coccineum]
MLSSYASKCQLWISIAFSYQPLEWDCKWCWGDFNEVRCKEDRWGSTFLAQGALKRANLSVKGNMIERRMGGTIPFVVKDELVNHIELKDLIDPVSDVGRHSVSDEKFAKLFGK